MESSPFISRLDSNYVATDSESLQIQDLLKGPTSRLEDLSIRLQDLQQQYIQVQNEQSSLLLSISKHRALISLVRKLPIDILQEIFIACLPTTHNSVMSKREPPILLTQVCSLWRNVAHSTPQLWKSIHIAVPCNTPAMYAIEYQNFQSMLQQVAHRRSEAVLEWLQRSAACPLDISLSQWENTAPDGFYDKIMECLIRFSNRWRDLSISAPYQALQLLAALPTSKVPLLESLFLNCSRLHFMPAPIATHLPRQSIWTTSGIMTAPNLREICLTQLNEDATRLPINWSQLTNLSLEGTSWGTSPSLSASRAYKILSSSRNLISCRLEIGIMSEYDQEPQPDFFETSPALVSLPYLTKLSIREGANLSSLFTLLHLPSLNFLEFHTAIWPVPESSTGLLSLIVRSQSIQHLITDAQFFKRQDFLECLRLCPFLKSLAIRQSHARSSPPPPWPEADLPACRVDDAFLNMFFTSSHHGDRDDDEAAIELEDPTATTTTPACLCPNLEDFESSSATAFSETTLLQFIKGKNGGGPSTIPGLAKLRSLFVRFQHHSLDNIKPELEPYIQAGLEATISYPPLPCIGPFSPFDGLPNDSHQPGYWPLY